VPLAEIVGLAVVLRKRLSAKSIDEYFAKPRPWLLLLAILAAEWTFVPAPAAFAWKGYPMACYVAALAALAWSVKVDRAYFSDARQILVQRLVSWTLMIAIFVAPAAWQVVASKLGI
jgi:hypothetical protein